MARPQTMPTRDYYAEVDHPAGQTLTPSVLDQQTEWYPQLKARPRVDIAVPKSPAWESNDLEGQPMRVWLDGQRLPIDTVRATGRSPDHDVLEGVGGDELAADVSGVEFPEELAHEAAQEAISTHTSYVADVDVPATQTRSGVSLQGANNTGSLTDVVADAPYPDDDPRYIFNNEVRCHPTAAFFEGEDADGGVVYDAGEEGNDGAWSGNQSAQVTSGNSALFDWSPAYAIPADNVALDFAIALPTTPTPAVTVTMNVEGGPSFVLDEFSEGALQQTSDEFDLTRYTVPVSLGLDEVPPGDHTFWLYVDSGEPLYLDFCHIRDDRFTYSLGDVSPSNAVVQGWESYPATQQITIEPASSVEQIQGATLDVTMADTSADQALGLRNDTADSWTEASNTATHSVTFDDALQLAQARVTLSRTDTGTGESGSFGAEMQTLDEVSLKATVSDMPVLLDFTYSGPIEGLLNEIADSGDFVWELRRVDGQETVVFTQPGQRVADREPALVEYSGRRTVGESYQHVIVQGKSNRVEAEEYLSNSTVGLFTYFDESHLVSGRERVYDSEENTADGEDPTEYERGVDYELDHEEGGLRILEGSNMETSTWYRVDYQFKYWGEYTHPDATDPDTLREEFPAASSDRAANQLAVAVVRELAAPLEEVEVTAESVDPTQPLTEALDPDRLPFEGPLRVEGISTEPGQATMTVGNRRGMSDVINDLTQRVQALARNV